MRNISLDLKGEKNWLNTIFTIEQQKNIYTIIRKDASERGNTNGIKSKNDNWT